MAKAPAKPKPETVTHYRSRPTAPNPFGDIDAPTVGTLQEVLAAGRRARDIGLDPVIEYRVPACPWAAYHPVVTVADLVTVGLAREKIDGYIRITAEGYAVIRAASRADPLDFHLDEYRAGR